MRRITKKGTAVTLFLLSGGLFVSSLLLSEWVLAVGGALLLGGALWLLLQTKLELLLRESTKALVTRQQASEELLSAQQAILRAQDQQLKEVLVAHVAEQDLWSRNLALLQEQGRVLVRIQEENVASNQLLGAQASEIEGVFGPYMRRIRARLGENQECLERVEAGIGATQAVLHRTAEEISAKLSRLDLLTNEDSLEALSKRSFQWLRYESVQDVEALLQLRALLGASGTTPLLGGWALDPPAMLSLVRHVLEHRPKLVVECGSGSSTAWLALALKASGAGRLVSLEHSEVYAAQTRSSLVELGLEAWAEVRASPLRPLRLGADEFNWYDASSLDGLRDIDLLLVDGPPGSTGPMARYPALPVLVDRLSDRASIVVDDVLRKEEKRVISRWKAQYPGLGPPLFLGARTTRFAWSRNER